MLLLVVDQVNYNKIYIVFIVALLKKKCGFKSRQTDCLVSRLKSRKLQKRLLKFFIWLYVTSFSSVIYKHYIRAACLRRCTAVRHNNNIGHGFVCVYRDSVKILYVNTYVCAWLFLNFLSPNVCHPGTRAHLSTSGLRWCVLYVCVFFRIKFTAFSRIYNSKRIYRHTHIYILHIYVYYVPRKRSWRYVENNCLFGRVSYRSPLSQLTMPRENGLARIGQSYGTKRNIHIFR